jgi:diaminopimelate decarboxylase
MRSATWRHIIKESGGSPIDRAILPDDVTFERGRLLVGGYYIGELANRFGTPLYVYDEATLRNEARRVLAAFQPLGARVSFAAKACSVLGILRIFEEEGLDLDVVSLGELTAGLRAGFRPVRLHLHGNLKTDDELEEAVRRGIRAIVIDDRDEIPRLEAICARLAATAQVMLRIALPLEAETHPHLRTSGNRSKFGLLRGSRDESEAFDRLTRSRSLRLIGVHAHLGSQIEDDGIYLRAARQLLALAGSLERRSFPIEEVSVGGGWAVPYTPGGSELAPERVAESLAPVFARYAPYRPAVEPGRALVARSAVAVYRVGSVKSFEDTRIVAVDGGMGDNPRPALYGAQYTAFLPERPESVPLGPAEIVGRYCETGDLLARSVPLPAVVPGDLLCIPVSGAYHLSMASAYNLVPQPAAVLVSRGDARLLVRRATVEDLLLREMPPGDQGGKPEAAQ